MIRALRRRHARMFAALTVLVPTVLVAALAARQPMPAQALPAALQPATPTRPPEEPALDWSGVPVRSRVWLAGARVELRGEALRSPDPLLYWAPEPPAGPRLPEGAVLIGPYNGEVGLFGLPQQAASGRGALVLYSLGHGEVLGHVVLNGGQP